MQSSSLIYPPVYPSQGSILAAPRPADGVPVAPDQACVICKTSPDRWDAGIRRHVFASQTLCSAACLEAMLRTALSQEHEHSSAAVLKTGPRVRIGEILVQQGVITEAQLERALRSQRLTGAGRLGTWLRQQTQLPEEDFAAALGIQWGCPVFRIGAFAPQHMVGFLPRTLVEALGALPLRLSRQPEKLTICFEDRLDTELLTACERMHGISVEGGLLASSEFWQGSGDLLKVNFPPAAMVEATSHEEMIAAMTESMVRVLVVNARLVYVRGYYWLRMWVPAVGESSTVPRDILCTLRTSAENAPEGQLADEMVAGLERKRVH